MGLEEQFQLKLFSLLEQPIEDGVFHPAEDLISEFLIKNRSCGFTGLRLLLHEQSDTPLSLKASILRCIGRIDFELVSDWGLERAVDALGNKDAELRDAAICALENWGVDAVSEMRPASYWVLRGYQAAGSDREDWLRKYVEQVIKDLSQ